MNKKHSLLVLAAFLFLFQNCNDSNKTQPSTEKEEVSIKEEKSVRNTSTKTPNRKTNS